MIRIIGLQLILQSRVSPKARKDVVRKTSIDGPYRNRKIIIPADIPTGPDSSANIEVRRVISENLRRSVKKGEEVFYVVAEFERTDRAGVFRYFKTIAPRTQIPF